MENDNLEPQQLSLDLNIEEPKKKKAKIHPCNIEIDLDIIKYNISHSTKELLIDTPILCESQELFYKKDLIYLLSNSYRATSKASIEERKSIRQKQPKLEFIEAFNGDILSYANRGFKFLIIYYFKDPLETREEKIAYINSLETMEQPKKYIYDLWSNKVIAEAKALNFMDKEALGLGLNEMEYFTYDIKPQLENYYTKKGIDEIEKYFKAIPKVNSRDEIETRLDTRVKSKEYHFFMDILIDHNFNRAVLENESIKCYADFLQLRIDRNKLAKASVELEYTNIKNEIDSLLKAINKTIKDLETYIELKENKPYKEVKERDYQRYSYLTDSLTDKEDKEYKEDIAYIESLKMAPRDSLDYIYYLVLKSMRLSLWSISLPNGAININTRYLDSIKDTNSIEYYFNELSKKFLAPEYHKRDLEKIETAIETAKGNIATYSLPILNELYMSSISYKPLKNEEQLASYKDLKEKIKATEQLITDLSKTIIGLSYEEKEERDKQLQAAEMELENLKKLIPNDIVEFKGEPYKAIISSNKKEATLEETDSSISLIIDDFRLIRPKDFTISTLNHKRVILKDHSLKELTPDLATKLNAFTNLIIEAASNTMDEVITLDTDEIILKLGYTQNNRLKALKFIKIFLYILQNQKIEKATIKGYKKELDISSIGFIADFNFTTKSISITLSPIIKRLKEAGATSKTWQPQTIVYDTPEELLINAKGLSLANQLRTNQDGDTATTRKVKISTFLNIIPSIADKLESESILKNFERDISRPTYSYFTSLNNNPLNPIEYLGINTIPTMRNFDDIERTIELRYRKEKPQKFINRENIIKSNKKK